MAPSRTISLVVAGLCIIGSASGFAGPQRQSSRIAVNIRGSLAATNPTDKFKFAEPEVIVKDEELNLPLATKLNNNLRTRITSVAVPAVASVVLIGFAATSYSLWVEIFKDTGFYQAFSLVFLSELGDKSFFVTALLAAKLSRVVSFVGSFGALAVMTVISVVIGQIFHAVPSELANGVPLDDVAAVIAFTYFGIKILSEAFESEDEGNLAMGEEFEEAEETVEGNDTLTKATFGAQIASIFALVFAAEFGDRSFLATIALSAAQNPVTVTVGAMAANGIATGIAVIGGAYISKYVSEKTIAYIGGTLFLIFAATTAIGIL